MKGLVAAGAGGMAVLVAMPLLVVVSLGGSGGSGGSNARVGGQTQTVSLNTALVPPQFVGFVQQAAATCPAESAPLIAAQIEAESGWNPVAQSPAGAQGIAQFIPGTWLTWGKDYDHDGAVNVFDPGDAIPAQGALMCALFASVKQAMAAGRITKGTAEENAIAAYNCGLGNVLRSGGFPTGIGETDAYVPKILDLATKYTAAGPGLPGTKGAESAIAAAKRYLGVPYVWGGGNTQGPTGGGFDCQGLTRYAIFQGYGVDISAGTRNQLVTPALKTVVSRNVGQPDPLSQMAPGDVVLMNYHPSPDGAWGHVALYLGAGMFIHAPHTGDVVKIVPAAEFGNTDWIVRRVP